MLVAMAVAIVPTALLLPERAWSVSLVATDSGFVTEAGGTDKFDGLASPATGNYSVGYELACPSGGLCGAFVPMQRKNYFVFDLSSISAPIVGASLELFAPPGSYESGGPGTADDDPFETYVIGATDPAAVPAVLGSISAIGAVSSTAEVDSGCADPLSPGPGDDPLVCEAALLYGMLADSLGAVGPGPADLSAPGTFAIASKDVTKADEGSVVSITFDAGGVAYLDSFAGGIVVLSGALTTSDVPGLLPQSIFGFTDVTTVPPPTLIVETAVIPLPAGVWLLVSAMGLLLASRIQATVPQTADGPAGTGSRQGG
ncbi:MAG: hypothetical protein D6727_07365 [Gammaproteobacteria bacterium]|nr:MAG: hypothetical protein D6727_07365 [Gammaproteobacteria bacterium]